MATYLVRHALLPPELWEHIEECLFRILRDEWAAAKRAQARVAAARASRRLRLLAVGTAHLPRGRSGEIGRDRARSGEIGRARRAPAPRRRG